MILQHFLAQFSTIGISGVHFPYAAISALGIGFLGAVSIGSVAWYNSRRPLGWEDKRRPGIVPDIEP
ncbi:MAG: hypothetical protein AAGE59_28040 [Cyanobacteria bacterium P01_F01_bin.86]